MEDEKCVIFQPLTTVDSNFDESNFVAPETLDGLPSIHADIWALGCVALYMCTGTVPCSKDLYNKKMPKIPACYSDDLVDLLNKMLQKDIKTRPFVDKILAEMVLRRYLADEFLKRETQLAENPGKPLDQYEAEYREIRSVG